MRLIWDAQFALIVGAHVLAVMIGFRLAGPRPAIAHLPMTALMVLYTILGLWLLSTPTGSLSLRAPVRGSRCKSSSE